MILGKADKKDDLYIWQSFLIKAKADEKGDTLLTVLWF